MVKANVLNIDIFKPSQISKDMKLSKSSETIIEDLQKSLRRILEETLNPNNNKEIKVEEDVTAYKILSELEINVNKMLEKSLGLIKTQQTSPKLIKLGELYGFACKNNTTIKKLLNSFYLTCRVYKGLLKSHPFIQDLQFKLLNVRRKVILETYRNDIRKGKLHHLRCSKSAKIVSKLPKKLKCIVRKFCKEMMKYFSKDGRTNNKHLAELRPLVGQHFESSPENFYDSIEESFIDYYREVHMDPEKTKGYIRSLKEISEAQSMEGEQVLLNYCDQEMAMEYLCLESDEVHMDYLAWDELAKHDIQMMRTKSPNIVKVDRTIQITLSDDVVVNETFLASVVPVLKVNTTSSHTTKEECSEEVDVGDFEDFQLVDEWESKLDDDVTIVSKEADVEKLNEDVKIDNQDHRPHRRKRTRFGPVSEEFLIDQMQQGSLGFSSTFVDEDENNVKSTSVTKVENKVSHIEEEFFEVKKDEDVQREVCDVVPIITEEIILESKSSVKVTPDDLLKSMVKQLKDSLKSITRISRDRRSDRSIVKLRTLKEPRSIQFTSSVVKSMSRDIYKDIEAKIGAIVQEYCDKRQLLHVEDASPVGDNIKVIDDCSPKINTPKAYSNVTVESAHSPKSKNMHKYRSDTPKIHQNSPEEEHSPSPTIFDRYIEASMKKSKRITSTPSHPVVVPRLNKSDTTSPDKSRLRAKMLSYKRDVKKAKVAITPRDSLPENSIKQSEERSNETEVLKIDSKTDNQQAEVKKETIRSQSKEKGEVASGHINNKRRNSEAYENSDGELSSSSDEKVEKKESINKQKQSKVKWLARHPDMVVSIPLPAPAAPFLDNLVDTDESQNWSSRKVFVVDAQDAKNTIAVSVKEYLKTIGACVFDSSNYKQAGKGLHVLIHNDWHFPDPFIAAPLTSPISLLFLKNNSGVHFLSYPDLDTVTRFDCSTVFPHSRSCLFLDHKSLLNTHPDNIRNMLNFMITERETSNRIWCLKIVSGIYNYFCDKIVKSETEEEISRLKAVQSIINEYSPQYREEESLSLVEIVKEEEDITKHQEQVLNQQYFLQKKFRHFCILTDNLNNTELDIRFLSTYGIAVLPLRTFLTNKIKTFVT